MRTNSAAPQRTAVAVGDRAPHLLTCHGSAFRELEQGLPCLEDRLLGGSDRAAEDDRDLLVREAAELAHHERGPLALG
jgi:hypothetical protein